MSNMEWTGEKLAILRDLIAKGKTASQIGDAMGITRNAVIGKCRRMGYRLMTPPTHVGPTVWTPDLIKRLKEMVDSGMTATQISKHVGRTARAVYEAARSHGIRLRHRS